MNDIIPAEAGIYTRAWQLFDQHVSRFGRPTAVWVQICIFAQNGATYNEVKQMIANARQHAASGATIYITGQPLYEASRPCTLAGASGPEVTDNLARLAAADSMQNVYPGVFRLLNNELSDSRQLLGSVLVAQPFPRRRIVFLPARQKVVVHPAHTAEVPRQLHALPGSGVQSETVRVRALLSGQHPSLSISSR